MLSKGTKVLESRELRTTRCVIRERAPKKKALARIMKYDGDEKAPRWSDVEPDRFETLCHVVADISEAPYTRKLGISGKMCFTRRFDVVLLVGLTELKAQIRWKDSKTGIEKSGDAVIVYGDASETSYGGPAVLSLPRYCDFDD